METEFFGKEWLATARQGVLEDVAERKVEREASLARTKERYDRYPPIDPDKLWERFEAATTDGRKVQLRWWRESDPVGLRGESVEMMQKEVAIYAAIHRTPEENANHLWVYEVYTGTTATRPIGDLVIEMVATGKVASLIVPRKDRWNRSVEFNSRARAALIDNDTDFVSVAEAVDIRTPQGRFFDSVLSAMAELEAETMKAKMRAGWKGAVTHKGTYLASEPPYGYRHSGVHSKGFKGVLAIDEREVRSRIQNDH